MAELEVSPSTAKGTVVISAAYIAGFVDGDGSIFASFDKKGYTNLRVSIAQCDEKSLKQINGHYQNNGNLNKGRVPIKKEHRQSWHLDFNGMKARKILEDCAKFGIIKAKQAEVALKLLDLPSGHSPARDLIAPEIACLNANKQSYVGDMPFDRISDAWLAGIFDAEGSVISGTPTSFTISISQAEVPQILNAIVNYLGYGSNYSDTMWKVSNKESILDFSRRVAAFLFVKQKVLERAVTVLQGRTRRVNTNRFFGVTRVRSGRFQTQLWRDKKMIRLGVYDTEEEAGAVVQSYLKGEVPTASHGQFPPL